MDDHNQILLTGETGTLSLARGEYVNALRYLYPMASTYWGDVAYIAERVLTTDELKQFVDVSVPAPPAGLSPADAQDSEHFEWPFLTQPAVTLRYLLARRLVRDGRFTEALAYFHAPEDPYYKDPDVRKNVTAYAQALHDAASDWWPIDRAHDWYRAAVLARDSGMEMMGYEAAPDYFATRGAFDWGFGQTSPGVSFVTDGERTRFAASGPIPDKRFHYRYIAVNQARHAADLLPPRSQAFAAVLCHATNWMIDSHDKQAAQALYHRYVAEGPAVPWATHFGQSCPEPEFDSASRLPRILFIRHTRHLVRRYRWPLGIFFGLALIAIPFAFFSMRNRQRE